MLSGKVVRMFLPLYHLALYHLTIVVFKDSIQLNFKVFNRINEGEFYESNSRRGHSGLR